MKRILWVLVAFLALAISLPAAAAAQGKPESPGKGQAKAKPAGKEKGEEKAEEGKAKSKKEIEEEQEREREAAQGRAFGKKHEQTIREWFGDKKNLQGLPPGLAKREELPPGLQRHLERNGTLPPGLQKRLEPLPASLDAKLPKLPEGVTRGVVAGSVVVIEERTSKILDIIKDVIGAGAGSDESSTGVRRTKQ